jgi:hypothetical protein
VSGAGTDGNERDNTKTDPQDTERTSTARPKKRAWKTPRVDSGKLFESNSLACGKATPHFEQCLQNPTRS